MQAKQTVMAIGAAGLVALGGFTACGGSSDQTPAPGPSQDAGDASDAGSPDAASDGGNEAASDAAADAPDAAPQCSDFNPLKNPYFGDLHLHTSYSVDAYSFGTRNAPLDAYAFAKGQKVQIAGAEPDGGGPVVAIDRPLDFLAVTDHSEFLALAYGCGVSLDGTPYDPSSPYYDSNECKLIRSVKPGLQALAFASSIAAVQKLCSGGQCDEVVKSAWEKEQQAAAAANDPCSFTSFVAYEWTKMQSGATLHKNVIFGSDKVPTSPLDALTYTTATDLWQGLDSQCDPKAGCSALTIPHNSNLSNGGAFQIPAGSEALMQKYQRLVEIFQHKGSSECVNDGNDPDCAFENYGGGTASSEPNSYVRTGLKNGLVAYAKTKTNPLMMGIVGATDSHNGTPSNVDEATWPGHLGRLDDSPEKRIALGDGGVPPDFQFFNPGGITGVWAEQNTRDAVFAALERRETFATSGPRMRVRFYQTYGADPCADPEFPAQVVAQGGVPMGGTFAAPPANTAPRFVVYAWKDKTDLERIDIIKAWVDGSGQAQETVVPFAATSGASSCVYWEDPSFTGGPAFYYARVLEVATPRWSKLDCERAPSANPTGCAPGGALDVMINERAWASPIWYMP